MNKNDVIEKYFDVRRGFSPTPNAENITRIKTDRQIIGGEDFGRYLTKIKPKYLIDEYSRSSEQIKNIQNKNMLAIQRIRTNSLQFNSRWIISQYFEKNFVPIDSIGYFLQNKLLDLKFLMAIINSKLLNVYYKLHFTDKNVKPIYLKKLPIINASIQSQEPFIKKVNLMLELNQKLQNSKQNFIDELELEKISKKLQNFEELEFEEFIKEIKKSKKLKFKDKLEERNFKNEWKALFENDMKIALDLKIQIDATDKKIDRMVYELYSLSDEEIKIIDGI
jgi:hypothetical protein